MHWIIIIILLEIVNRRPVPWTAVEAAFLTDGSEKPKQS